MCKKENSSSVNVKARVALPCDPYNIISKKEGK